MKLEIPPPYTYDAGRLLEEDEVEAVRDLYLNPAPKPGFCRIQSDNCHYAHGPVRRR